MSLLFATVLALLDSAHPGWMVGAWGWQNAGGTGDPALCGKPRVKRFTRVAPGVLQIAAPNPGKLIKCRAG